VSSPETQPLTRIQGLAALAAVVALTSGGTLLARSMELATPLLAGGQATVGAGNGALTGQQARSIEVIDTFQRQPASGELGHATSGQPWAATRGRWTIGRRGVVAAVTGPSPAIAVLDLGVDGGVEVRLTDPRPGTGVAFRYSSVAEHWRVVVDPTGDAWLVEHVENGRVRRVGSIRSARTSGLVVIRVEFRGERIRVFVNGPRPATFTESRTRPGGTRVGLVAGRADDGRAVFLSIAAHSELR
jgi:hypothetical protein